MLQTIYTTSAQPSSKIRYFEVVSEIQKYN